MFIDTCMSAGEAAPLRFCAYVITNNVNGKIYIGITKRTLATRFGHHLFRARHGSQTRLYAAIRKHGAENFAIGPVSFAVSWIDLLQMERDLIASRDAMNPEVGYNMTAGGEGTLKRVPSRSWRWKQSRLQSGRPCSEDTKAKYRVMFSGAGNPRFGADVSEVTRARISAALLGIQYPPRSLEHRKNIAAAVRVSRRSIENKSARVLEFRGEKRIVAESSPKVAVNSVRRSSCFV
jgi:group I intron endonuclease